MVLGTILNFFVKKISNFNFLKIFLRKTVAADLCVKALLDKNSDYQMIRDLFTMIEQTPGENSIKPDSQAHTVAEILR